MGQKYSTTAITGYNSSPPSDDGSSTEANKVKWSTIKTKLPDPLKTAIESINTKLLEALDTSAVSKTASTVSVGASDNGKLLVFDTSSNAITANLAAAATLGDGWICAFVLSDATNALTIDPNGSETINGESTHTVTTAYYFVELRCDGTKIFISDVIDVLGTAAVADIIGTVSESSGTPTGSIIERGSNANGEFVKFADGTLICTRVDTFDATSTSSVTYDFPSTFEGTHVAVSFGGANGTLSYAADSSLISVQRLASSWRLRRPEAGSNASLAVTLFAIGRWF
jgi:hypothetical protein